MITFRLIFIVSFLFLSLPVFSQTVDSLEQVQSDTLETIESDTSIIYVIQATPVTIRERIEVVRPRIKIPFYLSIGISILPFSEKTIATTSYETYTEKVNNATKNTLGYSIGMTLWRCPNKFYKGVHIDLKKINQQFSYTDLKGTSSISDNRFNYFDLGIQAGYWLRKTKPISFLPFIGITGEYLLSYSGFTLDKKDPNFSNRLNFVMNYRKYLLDLSVHVKIMINSKHQLFEIEPYFIFSPLSATSRNEVYSAYRSSFGLRIGITNKLF